MTETLRYVRFPQGHGRSVVLEAQGADGWFVPTHLLELLRRQDGVISRSQMREHGLEDHDIRRLIRRRELTLIHRGIYLSHTGQPTDRQKAWAAVLSVWPAALSHASALDLSARPIHVAVDGARCVTAPPLVVLHRVHDFDLKARHNLSPPRMRVEEAVLDCVAQARDEFEVMALLTGVVNDRSTTVGRIRDALAQRSRAVRRRLIESVLTDIDEGTCSTLEALYLQRVERPHGLPRPRRQHRPVGQRVIRDIDYEEFGIVIELDGRLFHDTAAGHDADLERDLDAKLHQDRDTVRLGWGQVVRRTCSTSVKIGSLLRNRGWRGRWRRCSGCP